MSNITMKQIATYCGVSQTTVSFVLNHRWEYVSVSTREKVLLAAKELGYRTNLAAVAMVTGKFNMITLLQDAVERRSRLAHGLINGILGHLEKNNKQLLISNIFDEAVKDHSLLPKSLAQRSCDGLLINHHFNDNKLLFSLLMEQGIPAIWLNINRDKDCVYVDELDSSYRLTQHFIQKGRKHFVYTDHGLNIKSPHYSRKDRFAGVQKAVKEAGLQLTVWDKINGNTYERIDQAAERYAADKPDCIIAYSDYDYLPFLSISASRRDLQKGKLAFGCFTEDLSYGSHPITYANCNIESFGSIAAEMLLKKIEEGKKQVKSVVLNREIISFDGL